MAVKFKTQNPQTLLDTFKKAIDDGQVVTWEYDNDGDFTHTPDQWRKKAWLRPRIKNDELVMSILKPKGVAMTSQVYAIYHGRFIESMLVHCDKLFSDGVATALPTDGDLM